MSRAERMRKEERQTCLSFCVFFWCKIFFVMEFTETSIISICLFQAKLTQAIFFFFKRMKCHVTNLQPFWTSYLLPAFQNYYIQA